MGELRLYAVGVGEVRGIFGATPAVAEQLRDVAQRAFAQPEPAQRTGLLSKLGPLFRRPPATPLVSPTDPEPHDVDVLLAGAYVAPDRMGASWRVVETLVSGIALGATRLAITGTELNDLDFGLARAGVSSALGLRHLLNSKPGLSLGSVPGLAVGCHLHERALAMAGAYHAAGPAIPDPEQRDLVAAIARWLDGFVPWAEVASRLHRPAPDLFAFFAE